MIVVDAGRLMCAVGHGCVLALCFLLVVSGRYAPHMA
jgi:hypothetical protein